MKYLLTALAFTFLSTSIGAQTFHLSVPDRADNFTLSTNGTDDIVLHLTGLKAGDEYGVQLRSHTGQNTYDFGALPAGAVDFGRQRGLLTGVAPDTAVSFCLEALEAGPGTVHVTLRKRSPQTAEKSVSPFAVTNSRNLDSLLNVVFRNESCFDLFPDTIITGDQLRTSGERVMQTGVFTGGMDVFGMEDGIIMSTGAVTDAVGPNGLFPRSQSFANSNNHIDLDAAIFVTDDTPCPPPTTAEPNPICYRDVAVIQFEFIPTTDTISFNYIFFSEEYCFSLNSGFSDAFAFFLEGPNVTPDGRANVARLPNGMPVSSQTLNNMTTPEIFQDNSENSLDPCSDDHENNPVFEEQTSYDGFSTKLQVKAAVTPCERHILKLMVIDIGDANNDTGILLEAGSFTAGLISDPEPSVAGIPGSLTPVEGCDTATLRFSRLFSDSLDILEPLAVNYNLITTGDGLNLADNNADFLLPPSPFIIPAGDTSATLKVPILADANNNEGVEAFIIKYDGTCNCDLNRDTFYIQDATELDVTVSPDQSACAGTELTLTVSATGGSQSYVYAWPDGQDTTQVTYTATGGDTLIYVSVIDSCGLTGLDSILVSAPNVSASTTGNFSLCSSPTAGVTVDVEGTGPFTINLRVDSGGVVTNTAYVISQDSTFVFDDDALVTVTSVTDANGCGGSATGTATVTSAGVSLTADVNQPDCDLNNGRITLTVAGGNENYTFTWRDDGAGGTSNTLFGLPPGLYTVDVARTSDPACVQTFSYTLSAPAALTVDSIVFETPDCPGESLTLAPVVSGGTAPYEFIWPDSLVTDSLLTIVSRGGINTYAVIVTDACNEETSSSVTINLPAFSADLSGRYSLCDDDTAEVPLVITGPAGDYFVEIIVATADSRDTITAAYPAGTTVFPLTESTTLTLLSIVNPAGCAGEIINNEASVVDPQLNFSATVTGLGCNGENTGGIFLTGINPDVPWTFTWADGPTTADRTNLGPGSYSLRIEDAADATCFRDTTFTIIEPDALSVTIVSQQPACPLTPDTLAAVVSGGTGPYTFSWPDSISTDSLLAIFVPGGVTMYPVSVTDACGATAGAMFMHDFPDVRAEVSGNYSVCNAPFNVNVPILLSGSAGNYEFTITENGVPRTLTASGDTLLNYTSAVDIQLISVTGITACPGLAGGIAHVTDGTFSAEATVTNILCRGDATGAIDLVLNDNPSGYAYDWSDPGLSGNSVSGLIAGTYAVTATEITANGCSWDTTFTLIEPTTSIALASDSLRDITCRETGFVSVLFAGGTGDLTYRWTDNSTDPELGVVPAGDYTVAVTDENGCSVTQTFTVADDRREVFATIAATATELSCDQPSLMLRAAANTFFTTYSWTDEAGNPAGTDREITVASPGTYVVVVEDPATGCTATDTITVALSGDVVALELAPTHAIDCDNEQVDLTVTHAAFTEPVTYEWRLNGNIVGTAATLTGITATGTYEVTVIRDDNGCPSTAVTEVIIDQAEPEVLNPNPVVTSSCLSPEVTIAVFAEGPYVFSWATSDGNVSGSAEQSMTTVDQPGAYTVVVRDTTNGCTTSRTVTVIADGEVLTPEAGTDQTLVCTGQGTILFGDYLENLPGARVRWLSPSGTVISEARQAFATEAGAFVFEAIHPVSGCSSFDTVMVINDGPTAVEYTLQQPPCPEIGGRLFVTDVTGNNGPFTFSSPTGQTDPFGNSLRGLVEGDNVLIVTDQLGCELRDTFQIFEFGEFTGRAPDIEIQLGEEAQLGVETNRGDGALVRWTWTNLPDTLACDSCAMPVVSPLESFVAAVAVQDTNGCILNLRQNVLVAEQQLVYLPTAFSPGNGDGVNDVYQVFGDADFVDAVVSFGIFDRWGSQVFGNSEFSVNDPAAGWDGMFRGKAAQPGVYVYTLTVRYYDDRVETFRGNFTLVR